VNFSTAQIVQAQPPVGSYLPVRITQTLPNCLVGEAIADADPLPFVAVQRASDFVVLNS
jgi:tRNA-2-methylthio-N6-dimethylallyladenosine synthase